MPGQTGKPTLLESFGVPVSEQLNCYCRGTTLPTRTVPITLSVVPTAMEFVQEDGSSKVFHGHGQLFVCPECKTGKSKFIPEPSCKGHQL